MILSGRIAANEQSRIFEKTHLLLANLSMIPEFQTKNANDCNSLVKRLLFRNEGMYNNILVVSPSGDVLCSGQSNGQNIEKDNQSYQMALSTYSFSVSDYGQNKDDLKPLLGISYPILDELGNLTSIFTVTMGVDTLNRILGEFSLPQGGSAVLVDRNGTIVAYSPDPDKWVGKVYPHYETITAKIEYRSDVSFEIPDENGVTWRYDVFRLGEPDGYLLIVRFSKPSLPGVEYIAFVYSVIGFCVAMVSMALLAWLLSRAFIEHPLEQLLRVTEKLGQGEYSLHMRTVRAYSIFGRLERSLDRVAESFHRKTAEQLNVEKLLRREEIRFHTIADYSHNWECWINQDGSFGYNSPACKTISGYEPDEFERDSDMMQAITYPQDRDRMNEHLREVHANLRNDVSSIEFRIITKAGKIRWLSHTCQPIFGPNKEYLGRRVTNQDVTKRKQTEESLRSTAQRFLSIVENQGEGIANIDADEYFSFSNPAADIIFGFNPGELSGRNLKEFVIPDHLAILSNLIDTLRRGEKSNCELTIMRRDGKKRIILIDSTPQYTKDGRYAGAFGVFRDVTEQKQREDRLVYTSTHDTLTGLYNRTYFEEEMEKAQASNAWPISIIVIDMDDLKIINDRLGHSAGDDLLRQTAKILRAALRPWDIVARFGGDEFVVLLPSVTYEAGQEILGRIRGIFEQHNKTSSDSPLQISLGLATGEGNIALIEIFNRADAAMYLDKKTKTNSN